MPRRIRDGRSSRHYIADLVSAPWHLYSLTSHPDIPVPYGPNLCSACHVDETPWVEALVADGASGPVDSLCPSEVGSESVALPQATTTSRLTARKKDANCPMYLGGFCYPLYKGMSRNTSGSSQAHRFRRIRSRLVPRTY